MIDHAPWMLGLAVGIATFATLASAWALWPLAITTPTGFGGTAARSLACLGAMVESLRRPRSDRRAADALADDVPDLVDLLVVAAAAGGNVHAVVTAGARRHPGPAAVFMQAALDSVASGRRLADALEEVAAGAPRRVRDVARPLLSVLVDSDRYGTPLAPSLERLVDDLRAHRQHRAEARARRVPVRLLLPLVLCVLPSFALLTVAPLLAGVARGALADSPSVTLEPTEEP